MSARSTGLHTWAFSAFSKSASWYAVAMVRKQLLQMESKVPSELSRCGNFVRSGISAERLLGEEHGPSGIVKTEYTNFFATARAKRGPFRKRTIELMGTFVVDGSVTLPWCFEDGATVWTEPLLDRLRGGDQISVPAHWPIEISIGMLVALRRNTSSISALP
jgi:hypothetical protein